MAGRTRIFSAPVLVFLVAALLGLGAALLMRDPARETPPGAAVPRDLPSTTAEDPTPPSSPVAPAHDSGADEILPTALPLSLVATMVRDDPALSLATIADLEHASRRMLAADQPLPHRPGVTLHRIERERVLIDNRGVIESLAMVRGDGPAPSDPPPFDIGDEERIRRRVLATRIRELTDHGLERRDETAEERPRIGLLAEGNISPVYGDDDALVGVQIGEIEEGGIYDRMGVQDGDVLTSINGISFGDTAAAAAVAGELALSEEIEVGVVRPDGSAETLSMPTEELRGYLQELEAQVYGNPPGEQGE